MKKRFQKISYCNRYIYVYDSTNEDELQNSLDIIRTRIDPSYDSAKNAWLDIQEQ